MFSVSIILILPYQEQLIKVVEHSSIKSEGNEINFNTIPTVIKRGLNESQKRAYVIADNWLGEQSSWDQPTLDSQLKLLQDDDFDLELVGFVDDLELDIIDGIEEPIVQPEVETQAPTFKITIDCANKQDQDEQYARLIEQGYTCKISSNRNQHGSLN